MKRVPLFVVLAVLTTMGALKSVYGGDNWSTLDDVKAPLDFTRPVSFPQPNSWMVFPVVGRSDEFALLPNSVRLRPDLKQKPEFRLLWNSLYVAADVSPSGVLYTVIEATYSDEIKTVINYLKTLYPQATLGLASPSKVKVEGLLNEPFGTMQQVREIPAPRGNLLMHVFVVDFALTRLGTRLFLTSRAGSAEAIGARFIYSVAGVSQGSDTVGERDFAMGATFKLDCNDWPDNYLDVLGLRKGCIDPQVLEALPATMKRCIEGAQPYDNDLDTSIFLKGRLAAIECT